MQQGIVVRRSKQLSSLLLIAAVGAWIGLPLRAFSAGPCSTHSASRQLDYWVGDWKVAGPGAAPNAASKVYLTLDECLVVESWDGGRGHKGQNVFAYNLDDNIWDGMFTDNRGRVHVFINGKVELGSAEFSGTSRGENGEAVLDRVKIVRISADKVEQIWEKSSDNGATWVTEFRGEYSRSKSG